MSEEQDVLNFFARAENLPLALSVADQADTTRQQLNNAFWLALRQHIATIAPEWTVASTEDRNAADCLVGLHLEPTQQQSLYLRPMLEQQYMGNTLRIYFGLMWSAPPTPELSRLDAVIKLRDSLLKENFKNNENFLAWRWTPYHPRRQDFLLRFSGAAEGLLDEVSTLMQSLLVTHAVDLHAANLALRDAPRSAVVSLGQLHSQSRLRSKL